MMRRVWLITSGETLMDVMPHSTSLAVSSGKKLGAWPQMPHVMPSRLAVVTMILQGAHDGFIPLVKLFGEDGAIAVNAQHELRQVIGPD